MWYQQRHDILVQYWSGPNEFISYFSKKSKKKAITSGGPNQWNLLPNEHQKMHGEQEETKQSRKDHERECRSGIE